MLRPRVPRLSPPSWRQAHRRRATFDPEPIYRPTMHLPDARAEWPALWYEKKATAQTLRPRAPSARVRRFALPGKPADTRNSDRREHESQPDRFHSNLPAVRSLINL